MPRIDDPCDGVVKSHRSQVHGWLALPEQRGLPTFTTAAGELPFRSVSRPDVNAAMPGQRILGFIIDLDLVKHIAAVQRGRSSSATLRVLIMQGGDVWGSVSLTIAPQAFVQTACAASL